MVLSFLLGEVEPEGEGPAGRAAVLEAPLTGMRAVGGVVAQGIGDGADLRRRQGDGEGWRIMARLQAVLASQSQRFSPLSDPSQLAAVYLAKYSRLCRRAAGRGSQEGGYSLVAVVATHRLG